MKIDSHQHFWYYDEKQYPWINNEMSSIKRDFLPGELKPLLYEVDFDGSVVVQARQTLEETEWLLGLASKNPFIKGVVGWVDLSSKDIEKQLIYYTSNDLLKGVRHVLQDETADFMLSDEFLYGISLLEKYNLTYDVLMGHQQLSLAIKLVEKFPNQKFVLDHIGKPDIKNKNVSSWKEHIMQLALYKNVYCKLSGMVTEADWKHCTENDFKSYLDIVFEAFGVDRLMIGSDWPVSTVSKEYSEVMNIVISYVSVLSEEKQGNILGKNCMNFYGIG